MTDSLKRLAPLAPDPRRSERVRARCRAQLERRAQRKKGRVVGPAVVGGVCLLYAAALVLNTLRLEGVLQ